MKKFIYTLLITGALTTMASAQESVFSIGWNVAIPTGELKEYIDVTSARGVRIGGRKWIYDNLSVGGEGGWQIFYNKYTGTENIDGTTDISGTFFKYVNAYPLMANVHFYLGDDGGVRPYLGTNIGVTFVNKKTDVGIWTVSDTHTQFTLAPEVGAFIPVGVAGAGLNLGFKYEYSFKTSDIGATPYASFFLAFAFFQ
jgi:outer membrane protein